MRERGINTKMLTDTQTREIHKLQTLSPFFPSSLTTRIGVTSTVFIQIWDDHDIIHILVEVLVFVLSTIGRSHRKTNKPGIQQTITLFKSTINFARKDTVSRHDIITDKRNNSQSQ